MVSQGTAAPAARGLRLQHRIVIPFIFVAFIATAAVALVAVSLIRHALENRVFTQLHNTSEVLSRTDFALNAAILRTTREITGADVITVTASGAIAATTVPDDQAQSLLAAAGGAKTLAVLAAKRPSEPVMLTADCSGTPCYFAYRDIGGRPGTAVAVIVRTNEVQSATGAITRTLVLSSAAALIVMVLVSQVVARRVTAPIQSLVAFTRRAAPGAPHERAAAGDDEVGRLAAAFNHMLDRLDQAQEALVRSEKLAVTGLLAARVAHDIRNPLSSIKMQTQLLRAQAADDEARAIIDAVLHDVDQVEAVIRGLLELARPGGLNLKPVALNDVIAQLLQRLAPQFAHRKVAVVTRFDQLLPASLFDPDRLEQAVLNVVLNAADAMPYGGTLTVSTRLAGGSAIAVVEICDDGVGIAADVLDRIFDPFVSTKRDGVGLGLVNTKAVVESHGGRIEVERRSPQGTIVRLTLPLRAAADTQTIHG